MNSVIWYLFVVCLAEMQAAPSLDPLPVNPGGIGGIFRGPNSETIIKGPDGSQIVSEQVGGAVETRARLDPIIIPDAVGDQIAVPSISVGPVEAVNIAPEIAVAISSDVSVPAIELQTPLQPVAVQPVIPVAPPQVVPIAVTAEDSHIIETEYVDAPEIEPDQSSVLKGPSGTISVRGSSSIVSGPASTTISEPIRKIPIAAVPLQQDITQPQLQYAPAIAPSEAFVAPSPVEALVQPLSPPSLTTGLVAPAPGYSSLRTYEEAGVLRTEFVHPPVSSTPATPLSFYDGAISPSGTTIEILPISLTETSGAGIADATLRTDLTPPHITIISSTKAPPVHFSTQNSIDLGQGVVSSTASPLYVSSADIDASRINLGQTYPQEVEISNIAPNWSIPPSDRQNIIYSNGAPKLPPSRAVYNSEVNGDNSLGQPNRPLLITAADLQGISYIRSSPATGNFNFIPESASNEEALHNQVVSTNQFVSSTPRYIDNGSRNLINPYQSKVDITLPNIQSRSWLIEEPTQILPSTISPPSNTRNHGQPIVSFVDSVIVQPTDPRNREIIEFGGKQLENVGNIVPILQHPVLVTGDLNSIQQIPTASISQLSSRNELDPNISNRYGRNALN